MANVFVSFAMTAGGGSVRGADARTGAGGVATVGAWTLGTATGTNRLSATVSGVRDPLIFTAATSAGAAATLTKLVEPGGTLVVGTPVATLPSVQVTDQFGNAVAGQVVTFSAAANSGTLTGATVTSGADGVATLGGWTLGTRAGAQTVSVSAGPSLTALLTANAVAGDPHAMVALLGLDQIGVVGTAVPIPPVVKVTDQFGNAAAGRQVMFSVSGGGGHIGTAAATVSALGEATMGSWTLGAAEGINTISAQVAGLPALSIGARAVPQSEFDVTLRYLTAADQSYRDAFTRAAARWRKVVIGDLSPGLANLPANACGADEPALNETIDDVLIYVSLVTIDGPGSVLGSAYPCARRTTDGLTAIGVMRFDLADLAALEARGQLEAVILHEMGHVFGLGTFWEERSFLTGAGTDDPYYTGASARSGFQLVGGAAYGGPAVPVENVGGSGTRDAHWRNSVLRTELMTGFAEGSAARLPLSMVTIGGMEDLGYPVTPFGYDEFRWGTDLVAPGPGASASMTVTPPLQLREAPPPMAPITLDESGRPTTRPARPVRVNAGRVQALARELRSLPAPQREVRRSAAPR
jgi:hypothetical protein